MSFTSASTMPITWTTTGQIIDTVRGERPAKASEALLSTRAVESKRGWLGQIVMLGNVVYEVGPFKTSEKAMRRVNSRIYERIRLLIVGDL